MVSEAGDEVVKLSEQPLRPILIPDVPMSQSLQPSSDVELWAPWSEASEQAWVDEVEQGLAILPSLPPSLVCTSLYAFKPWGGESRWPCASLDRYRRCLYCK